MANQESLFPVPYNQEGSLSPLQRRSLTKHAEKNPVRNEARALIAFTPDEAMQVMGWTNNAGVAIREIEEIIVGLPGEVRTSMTEELNEETTEQEKRDTETYHSGKLSGFFTINWESLTTGSTNIGREVQRRQERSREQVAKTRPGQLLTGDQVRDALDRVAIARGEGLLYLPASHSELTRRQTIMLQTVRRVLEDHSGSNTAWAEDIQQGTVEGLIGQLNQSVESYKNGYVPDTLRDEVGPYISETIDDQVSVTLETSFIDLLRFSLVEGRDTSIVRAGRAVQKCLLEDIYPRDTERFVSLMNKWYQIFLGEKPRQNAQIIGMAFAETFAEGVLKSREDEVVFGKLNELSGDVARNGGARLLLDAMTTRFRQDDPNARVISLMKNLSGVVIEDMQNRRDMEPNLISLIRASLLKTVSTENPELTESLVAQLSQVSRSSYGLYYIDYFGHEVSLKTLLAMASSIKGEEWDDLVRKQGKKTDDVNLRIENTHTAYMGDSRMKVDLDEIENYELAGTLRTVFATTLNASLTNDSFRRVDMQREALKFLFNQLTPEQQNSLITQFGQSSQETINQALDYVNHNMGKIVQMASSKILVEAGYGERQKLPDPRMRNALNSITVTSYHSAGSGIKDAKPEDQLRKVEELFKLLTSYSYNKWTISQRKPTDSTRQAFETFFTDEFEDIRSRLNLISSSQEVLKTSKNN